ncbi:MAG TPA: translation initiation factor IF-2 [Anaeromyxobacter sp.]
MATKKRPRSARETVARRQAEARRGAPGKRFIGERAEQGAAARRVELKKVARMAEAESAARREEAVARPVAEILAELIENTVRLVRTIAGAPLRIVLAIRQPRTA